MNTHKLKLTSLLVIASLLSDLTGISNFTFSADTNSNRSLNKIHIPNSAATVVKDYNCNSNKWVVCIQDYHANPNVQTSVSNIIKSVCEQTVMPVKKYYKNGNEPRILVAIEGHAGNYPTSEIRNMENVSPALKNLIIDYFFLKGRLDGAEYLDMKEDCSITLYGAENQPVYEENLKLFLECINEHSIINKQLSDLELFFRAEIDSIFSKHAKELIKIKENYFNRIINLFKLAQYIKKQKSEYNIDLTQYSAVNELLDIINRTTNSNDILLAVNTNRFAKELSEKIEPNHQYKVLKTINDFEKEKTDITGYVLSLTALAEKHIPDKTEYFKNKYPAVFKNSNLYTQLSEYSTNLLPVLDCSITILFNDIAEKSFESKELKIYHDLIRLEKIKKLANLELSDSEWQEIKKTKKEITEYLTSNGANAEILSCIDRAFNFYTLAEKRNSLIVKNLLSEMEKGYEGAVLLAGGFHTSGITDILEKENINYKVIVPKFTKNINKKLYYEIMDSAQTDLELRIHEFISQTIKPPTSTGRVQAAIKFVSDLTKRNSVQLLTVIAIALGVVSCGDNPFRWESEEKIPYCSIDYPDSTSLHVVCGGGQITLDHSVNLETYDIRDRNNRSLNGLEYYDTFIDILIAIEEMIFTANGGYGETQYSEADLMHFQEIYRILLQVPSDRILVKDYSTQFDSRIVNFSVNTYETKFVWTDIPLLADGATINLNTFYIIKSDGTVLQEGDPDYYPIIDAIAEAARNMVLFASGEAGGYSERPIEEILVLSKIRDRIAESHAFVAPYINIEDLGNGRYHIRADGRSLQLENIVDINTFEIFDANGVRTDSFFNVLSALEELIFIAGGGYDESQYSESDLNQLKKIYNALLQIPPELILVKNYSIQFDARTIDFYANTYETKFVWPDIPLLADGATINLNTFYIIKSDGTVLQESDPEYYPIIDAIAEAARNMVLFASGEAGGYSERPIEEILVLSKIRDSIAESHAFVAPYINIEDLGNGRYHIRADGRLLQIDNIVDINTFDIFDANGIEIVSDAEYFNTYFDILSASAEHEIYLQLKNISPDKILIQDFSASFANNIIELDGLTKTVNIKWPETPLLAQTVSINLNTNQITLADGTVLIRDDDKETYDSYFNAITASAGQAVIYAVDSQYTYTPRTTKEIVMLQKIRDKLNSISDEFAFLFNLPLNDMIENEDTRIASVESFLNEQTGVRVTISPDSRDTYAWLGNGSTASNILSNFAPDVISALLDKTNINAVNLVTDEENQPDNPENLPISEIVALASNAENQFDEAINSLSDKLQVALLSADVNDMELKAVETAESWINENSELVIKTAGIKTGVMPTTGLYLAFLLGLNLPAHVHLAILNAISKTLFNMLNARLRQRNLDLKRTSSNRKIIVISPDLLVKYLGDFKYHSFLTNDIGQIFQNLTNNNFKIVIPVLSKNQKSIVQDAFNKADINIDTDNILIEFINSGERVADIVGRLFPEQSSYQDIMIFESETNVSNRRLIHNEFDSEASFKSGMKVFSVAEESFLTEALALSVYFSDISENDYKSPELNMVRQQITAYYNDVFGQDIDENTVNNFIQILKAKGVLVAPNTDLATLNILNSIRNLTYAAEGLAEKSSFNPVAQYFWLDGVRVHLLNPAINMVDLTTLPKTQEKLLENRKRQNDLIESMI